MQRIKKKVLRKRTSNVKLFYSFSVASIGSENCCNGSFACCGATTCH